jgi:hypothetical protein
MSSNAGTSHRVIVLVLHSSILVLKGDRYGIDIHPMERNRALAERIRKTPPMRFREPDHNAAVVLQEVLIENGFSLPSGPDGIYGRQTAAAVQAAEVQFGLDTDQGVAGREVLGLGPGQAL